MDVEVGREAGFLAPESVELLPDLDPKLRTRLDDYQLDRIGEIQVISDDALASVFGPAGRRLGAHARGLDARPVLPPAVRAEFRVAHTLGDDSNDIALLHRVLRHLTERLGARLRARQLVARRLTVQLAYTDYLTARRSVPLSLAALDIELWDAARRAFTDACQRTVALRAVGVTVDRFLEASRQLELWEAPCVTRHAFRVVRDEELGTHHASRTTHHAEHTTTAALQTALDRIRSRWGRRGVRMGA